jgi:hypothetical protein
LKSTGLVLAVGLWETWGMAKYTPKEGDVVFRDGEGMTRFVITLTRASDYAYPHYQNQDHIRCRQNLLKHSTIW